MIKNKKEKKKIGMLGASVNMRGIVAVMVGAGECRRMACRCRMTYLKRCVCMCMQRHHVWTRCMW